MNILTKKYTDLSFFMTKNPYTNDINVVKDGQVFRQGLKNLLFTNPGERMFNHSIGSSVSILNTINMNNISERIEALNSLYNTIYKNDNRIEKLEIDTIDEKTINISYSEKNSNVYSVIDIEKI